MIVSTSLQPASTTSKRSIGSAGGTHLWVSVTCGRRWTGQCRVKQVPQGMDNNTTQHSLACCWGLLAQTCTVWQESCHGVAAVDGCVQGCQATSQGGVTASSGAVLNQASCSWRGPAWAVLSTQKGTSAGCMHVPLSPAGQPHPSALLSWATSPS